jgi:hypothetical protein
MHTGLNVIEPFPLLRPVVQRLPMINRAGGLPAQSTC